MKDDLQVLQNDLHNLEKNLDADVIAESSKVLNKLSKYWVTQYKSMMDKTSLMNANVSNKVLKSYATSEVSITLKSIEYDLMTPHFVTLNHKAVKDWVKKKWSFTNVGWRAREYWGKQSYVYGSETRPVGELFVVGRKYKFGYSIIEEPHRKLKEHIEQDIFENDMPLALKMAVAKSLTKKTYSVVLRIGQ